MSSRFSRFFAAVLMTLGFAAAPAVPGNPSAQAADAPRVRLTTNLGVIVIELDPARAPKTVENFLAYVRAGHYDGTIFHRVMRGFMIQGGGFTAGMNEKPTRGEIRNEADNGLKNVTGAIAMARRNDPHSASSQFFINTVDNDMLNNRGTSRDDDWGYAVFGRVVDGMDTVRVIEGSRTTTIGPFENVPRDTVTIEKAEILN